MAKEIISFRCPVCKTMAGYTEKFRDPVIIGGKNVVEYCICNSCSAIFADPKKFNAGNISRNKANKL